MALRPSGALQKNSAKSLSPKLSNMRLIARAVLAYWLTFWVAKRRSSLIWKGFSRLNTRRCCWIFTVVGFASRLQGFVSLIQGDPCQ